MADNGEQWEQWIRNGPARGETFPVVRQHVFLAHAAVCPLPRPVADAVRACAEAGMGDDQERGVGAVQLVSETRARAAALVGAEEGEIALVGPTSTALSYIAAGYPWQRGDRVLVYFDDYPSNVYPWLALATRGVTVDFLRTSELGRLDVADILAQVKSQTRLVALASCHFIAGYRLDVERLGQALREQGIRLCVDGIQTLGAFPTPARACDYLAADAHKWMLGPCSAGFMYVRRELQDELQPMVYGWHNVRCPDFVAQSELHLRRDARRYEAGSHSLVGLAGLNAALRLILECGVHRIAERLQQHRARLVTGLRAKGYDVLCADAPASHQSGITSFARSGLKMREVHARLAQEGYVTSLRTDRSGRDYVRLSPHFYNTEEELDDVLKRL